jgi:glutamate-1-semialdehyde 2,1-aminomutase
MNGLREAAASAGHQLLVQGPGPMFHTGFTSRPSVTDFRDTLQYDKVRLQQFIAALHDHGIRVIGRGLWYVSAAHKEEDISRAIDVSRDILHNLK